MLNALLNQVKQAIYNDPTTPHTPTSDPSGLIGQIESLFGQHQTALQQGNYAYAGSGSQHVRPASEDPLGDPGAGQGQQQFAGLRPASEDPLGDPGR